ncbi:UvrD-helicase domain-containing protein [Planctomyces sp. SH-PL14]|uniref:UvrD-helicase domain-containing protein n=1 Tax=Planctomyces sp. SH-PL14 TaxID=1632864 RepID=UPI00078BEA80|nr:ATP-dependent helicase [Planctomyces sp. SH-PL14]AMV20756.1 ATP-dependent DNA helicase PcrA [Planctomyces sp. SH-PL14]
MPQVARIIGGAGTGKTTYLLERMDAALSTGGYTPFDVGFCSFTRAACLEAARRAGAKFDVDPADLAQHGWFKTLHACCYRLVGIKGNQLLAGNKKDREWLTAALQEEISETGTTPDLLYGNGDDVFAARTDADRILSLWSTARSRLVTLEKVWEPARYCDERTPDLARCREIVARYEQAKRIDGRIDFVDLLGRYAGVRWSDARGPRETTALGDIPDVPVWFLDEQQDTSPLLDRVSRRLVSRARWIYLCLDPFQAIYGWNGADARCAMGWPAKKQQVMPRTWRCPAPVQQLGGRILRSCTDYWDRQIAPAPHRGEITAAGWREAEWLERICDEIRHPTSTTASGGRQPPDQHANRVTTATASRATSRRPTHMLLARSNYHASRIARRLDALHIPWLPTTGQPNRWNAPVRQAAIMGFRIAQDGYMALGPWRQIVRQIPSEGNLVRGTKARFEETTPSGIAAAEDSGTPGGDEWLSIETSRLTEWGATEALIRRIQSGEWVSLIDGAAAVLRAIDDYGPDAVESPRVLVGTIHSAKGMEADNVYLLTTLSHQVIRGMETTAGADEERRVQYVGVTRARHRLTLLQEGDARYAMDLPT